MSRDVKKLVVGVVLFVLGGLVVPVAGFVFFFYPMVSAEPAARFVAPANVRVEIEEAGRYVLWNEYESIYKGQTFAVDEDLPSGISMSFVGPAGVGDVEMDAAMNSSVSTPSTERKSVGVFEVDEPGRYVLSVAGEFEARVFSLRKSVLYRSLMAGLGVLAVSVPLSLAGIGLGVAGIAGMVRSKGE
ncbi:hypothetical protein STSP2_01000 [Anaerohalosphaera lusitana]|uniref:Uncharacterized protein n=1 Tax=Anaerohalosphaera lusitana TaxID=1936003 RepID=A0A1U9NJD0_9BACT|nr:hypothetical protein [Anaerohalosphaera lusitana]AQT67848.1 hypothetical protein STSP2_01000 [Anaerohalosphaera lusitana]